MYILSFVPIQRSLTSKQKVILRSVAVGKTNKDIAADLGISEQGVKVHISRLLERYGAENRVQLVTLARAWPNGNRDGFAEIADIDGIRDGLNKTYRDATLLSASRGGNADGLPVIAARSVKGHAAPTTDLAAQVRSLREGLAEINVALKLAREMPQTADVGPIVDAIRARVAAALEQSAVLDALLDDGRQTLGQENNAS